MFALFRNSYLEAGFMKYILHFLKLKFTKLKISNHLEQICKSHFDNWRQNLNAYLPEICLQTSLWKKTNEARPTNPWDQSGVIRNTRELLRHSWNILNTASRTKSNPSFPFKKSFISIIQTWQIFFRLHWVMFICFFPQERKSRNFSKLRFESLTEPFRTQLSLITFPLGRSPIIDGVKTCKGFHS